MILYACLRRVLIITTANYYKITIGNIISTFLSQVSLQNFIQIIADIHVGLFNLSKMYPTFSDGLNEAVDNHMVAGISINNLSKKYGKTKAVDNINAEFYENQVTILLGHNGAAKTTTL